MYLCNVLVKQAIVTHQKPRTFGHLLISPKMHFETKISEANVNRTQVNLSYLNYDKFLTFQTWYPDLKNVLIHPCLGFFTDLKTQMRKSRTKRLFFFHILGVGEELSF